MGNVGRATVVASALWASIAITMAVDGGFGDRSQVVFVTLAGFVLLAGLLALGPPPRLAPPALVLILLGLLGCASAAWTVSDPESAIRAGAVTLSLAALVIVSARLAAQRRPTAILTIGVPLATIATVCGLIGLLGVATGTVPFALRIEGVWRPAGPLEYPPALAMLEIMALPLLFRFCAVKNRVAATAAAAAMVVAVAVLVLAESRLGLVLGAATACACVLAPMRASGLPARRAGHDSGGCAGGRRGAPPPRWRAGRWTDRSRRRNGHRDACDPAGGSADREPARRPGSTNLRPTANHGSSFGGRSLGRVGSAVVAASDRCRRRDGARGPGGPGICWTAPRARESVASSRRRAGRSPAGGQRSR